MSTDDQRPDAPDVPRTRAEMRAAREAAAAEAEVARSADAGGGAERDDASGAEGARFVSPAARSTGGE
ncbi:hypothetical protein, partial [Microbacterium foliorum]|uniref:hypothetical protein n=1 Tax=Microbacterium foliorum TaxID=104336 RepID=UPI001E59A287